MPEGEREVTVYILGTQTFEGMAPEPVEQVAGGRLRREGEEYVLTYREGEETGLGETRTTLRVSPERVVLEREGEYTSRMVFQAGAPPAALAHRTPFGVLPLEIRTHRLWAQMGEDGGEVAIEYGITLGRQAAGEHSLRIRVREGGHIPQNSTGNAGSPKKP